MANAPIPTSRKAALAWQRLNGVSSSGCPAARQFDGDDVESVAKRLLREKKRASSSHDSIRYPRRVH